MLKEDSLYTPRDYDSNVPLKVLSIARAQAPFPSGEVAALKVVGKMEGGTHIQPHPEQ